MADVILGVEMRLARNVEEQQRITERVKGIMTMDRVVDKRKLKAVEMKWDYIRSKFIQA